MLLKHIPIKLIINIVSDNSSLSPFGAAQFVTFVILKTQDAMPDRLKGKVVIVTGASSGIGKALALECGRQGADVVLAARRIDLLKATADAITAGGSRALAVTADVSRDEDCKALINKAVAHFGKIDVLINNAGVSMRALFDEADPAVIRRVMDINFFGTVQCTRYALPHLLKTRGSVVGISSVAGFKGLPGRTGYSASKFAIHGFLEALRIENMKKGLHVLIVCPGFTASEIREKALTSQGMPQGSSPRNEGKMMKPSTVAFRTLRAIKNRRRLIILTKEGKFIIALQRIIPTILDRIVYNRMAREPDAPFR
jgi:dehydrogenase/reductase SDR family member 7B